MPFGELFATWSVTQRSFWASPYQLNLVDIRAQEASRGDHLLEGVGEVMGPLVVIVGVMHFEILPSGLDEFRVFPEGFQVALLEEPYQGSPLFLPLAGPLFRSDV